MYAIRSYYEMKAALIKKLLLIGLIGTMVMSCSPKPNPELTQFLQLKKTYSYSKCPDIPEIELLKINRELYISHPDNLWALGYNHKVIKATSELWKKAKKCYDEQSEIARKLFSKGSALVDSSE